MRKLETKTSATFTTTRGETISIEKFLDGIYGEVFSGFGSTEDKMDLFQEAAYKGFRYLNSYDSSKSASVKTYGSRVAWNCSKDAYSKEARRTSVFVPLEMQFNEDGEYFIPAKYERCADDSFGADSAIESSEAIDRINCAIDSLNPNYSSILRMVLEGKDSKEMAEIIGCPVSIVHKTVSRARESLAKKLGRTFLRECGVSTKHLSLPA